MDVFARALIIADKILRESDYLSMIQARYASFDKGLGGEFEKGSLTLMDLYQSAQKSGEPKTLSGKQELIEQMINWYI